MSLHLTDDKSTLVQVIAAWCRQTTSHYLSQCWTKSMSPNGVTRPQWVKILMRIYIAHQIIRCKCGLKHRTNWGKQHLWRHQYKRNENGTISDIWNQTSIDNIYIKANNDDVLCMVVSVLWNKQHFCLHKCILVAYSRRFITKVSVLCTGFTTLPEIILH